MISEEQRSGPIPSIGNSNETIFYSDAREAEEEAKATIQVDGMEIIISKMHKIMEVDMASLEAGRAKHAMEDCKETMIQTLISNAIIVEKKDYHKR